MVRKQIRNNLIIELCKRGVSSAIIAKAADITSTRVRQIYNGSRGCGSEFRRRQRARGAR
jgi:hypothetical protein